MAPMSFYYLYAVKVDIEAIWPMLDTAIKTRPKRSAIHDISQNIFFYCLAWFEPKTLNLVSTPPTTTQTFRTVPGQIGS
jgi:hypothetical protein